MISSPILEIDLHGCTAEEAIRKLNERIASAGKSVYRIRVIHGYHGGSRIRDAVRREFGYGLEPKIKRIIPGSNEGITELVLREY